MLSIKKHSIAYLFCILSAASSAAQTSNQKLELGTAVEGEISKGETHSYRIAARKNDFIRVVIVQKNVDVSLHSLLPNGEKFYTVDNSNNREENEKISMIADANGDYQFEVKFVRSLAGKVPGKGYEIRLESARPEVEKDRFLIQAERLYDQANLLRFERSEAKRRESIKVFQSAIPLFSKAGDRLGEAFSFFAIGQVSGLLSDYAESKKNYDAAIAIFRELNAKPQLAMALESEAPVYFRENNLEKSVELLNQALQLYQELGYREKIVRVSGYFGAIYSSQNQPHKAIEYYEKALPILLAENDKAGAGSLFNNLGYSYDDLGEPQKALENYEKGLLIFEEIGDSRMRANILANRAIIYKNFGEAQRAIESLTTALAIFQQLGEKNGIAACLNNLAAAYHDLGEREKAREFYEKALALNRETKVPLGEASVLNNLAVLKTEERDFQGATDLLTQALQIFREIKNKRGESRALVKLGEVWQKKGENPKSLEFFQQALTILREIEDRDWEGLTLYLIGDTLRINKDLLQAREFCLKALQIKRELRQPLDEAAILFCLAKIEKALGDLSLSQNHIESAIKNIEEVRSKLSSQDFRASYFARNQDFYEFYINLLINRHRAEPDKGFDALTLQTSERARARNLLESLGESKANIRAGITPELLEKERNLRRLINAKDAQRMNALRAKSTAKTAELEKELSELLQKYRNAQAEIRAKSPKFAALTQPEPLNLKAIQTQILDANTVLLEYFLGAENSLLFVVNQGSMEIYDLPKREVIESTARIFLDSVKARAVAPAQETIEQRQQRLQKADLEWRSASDQLSRILLTPVASKLINKRLLIVSSGALQYVPFAALRIRASNQVKNLINEQKTSDGQFLIETSEIVNLPSASALAILRKARANRQPRTENIIAVLADPVFSAEDMRFKTAAKKSPSVTTSPATEASAKLLPSKLRSDFTRLRFSRLEAETISSLTTPKEKFVALDFDANLQTVTSESLSEARIIHFATHGFVNSDFPELSGIVLSLISENGQPQDGFLRLHDIYNLNLNAELVLCN